MSKNLFQKTAFQEDPHTQSSHLRASRNSTTSNNNTGGVQSSYQSLKSVLTHHHTAHNVNSNQNNKDTTLLNRKHTLPAQQQQSYGVSNTARNFGIKKQLSTSSYQQHQQQNNHQSSGVQQQQSNTSRFGLKPHFEIANIGIRKGSMQTTQQQQNTFAQIQSLNMSQASHNHKQGSKQMLQHQQQINNNQKNMSQNRLTASQKDIPNTHLLLSSLEQFQGVSQFQNMIKQSRNSNIPKSSSQQNPTYKSQQSSQDHPNLLKQGGNYPSQYNPKLPLTQANLNHINFHSNLSQISANTQPAQLSTQIQSRYSSNHLAILESQPSHPTQCETGASIDNLQNSNNSNASFMMLAQQRPVSNLALFNRQETMAKNNNQTVDLASIKSSIISSSDDMMTNGQQTNTASLLEGAVGVQLPQSKINTAAQRQHQLTKNLAKDVGDEGENINASDEEISPSPYDRYNQQNQKLMRSTILDQEVNNNEGNYSSSSSQSFDGPDGEGILPLLEGFVKKCDLISIRQFQCLIKGEIQKSLLYRAIEFKQVPMLKYLLTETQKINQNLNLLHIACRQKDPSNSNEYKELEIVRSIMKYDKFSDLNTQDTYGNTPIHLAAQNGKAVILQFFLNNYNPNIYIKNSEGQLALNTASTQEILKIFVTHIQKLKEALTQKDDFLDSTQQLPGSTSSRSHKQQRRVISRNKSEHQLSSSIQQNQQQQQHQEKAQKRMPLKDISQNYHNSHANQHHLQNENSQLSTSQLKLKQQLVNKQQQPMYHHKKANTQSYKENLTSYYCETEPSFKTHHQNAVDSKAQRKRKDSNIQQYESIMDYCNQQQKKIDKTQDQQPPSNKPYLIFKEDEFEKVVEFTESDEEGSQFNDKVSPQQFEDEEDQTLQFCEEIEEVSCDESLMIQQETRGAESNQKIGPQSFEPISLIGQGSFGEVYLVKKKDTNTLYAMKVLQKQRIMGQNLVKYAITERNVLSYTRHPFIVGLNYAFQTRDKLFLILDYAPGGDLGKVLSREKRLTEERARLYLCEILLALEDLHKRDIIFRDLKPDNVVLDEQGHVMLTDFGLSKEGVLDNQAAKSFCGSVAYLAPEMLKRTGHGKSVDWYLLGVLLYEMLVGIPPYFNNNREKLFQNIQRGPLLIPSQLSKEAKTLLIGLLSKNSMKRLGAGPRDAEEIKEHEFFRDINWDDVSQKKLTPPKPEIREINKNIDFPYGQFLNELKMSAYGDINEDENKLQGWSFVTPNGGKSDNEVQGVLGKAKK